MSKNIINRVNSLIRIPFSLCIVIIIGLGLLRIDDQYNEFNRNKEIINFELKRLAEGYLVLGDLEAKNDFVDRVNELQKHNGVVWVDVLDYQRVPIISSNRDRTDYYTETIVIDDTTFQDFSSEFSNPNATVNNIAMGYIVIYRTKNEFMGKALLVLGQCCLLLGLMLTVMGIISRKITATINKDIIKITNQCKNVLISGTNNFSDDCENNEFKNIQIDLNKISDVFSDNNSKILYLQNEIYELTSKNNKQLYRNSSYINVLLTSLKTDLYDLKELNIKEIESRLASWISSIEALNNILVKHEELDNGNNKLEEIYVLEKQLQEYVINFKAIDNYDITFRVNKKIEHGFLYMDVRKTRSLIQFLVEVFQSSAKINPMIMLVINKPEGGFCQISIILSTQTSSLSSFAIEHLKNEVQSIEKLSINFDAELKLTEGYDNRIIVSASIMAQYSEGKD